MALENRSYQSGEQQRFSVDKTIAEIDPLLFDLLILPGGDSAPLYENRRLKNFISAMLSQGKAVAAICGGSELLAAMGFLTGKHCTGGASGVSKTDTVYPLYREALLSQAQVVLDGSIITAQGQAYLEFAVTVAKYLGILKDDPAKLETLNWLKNRRGEASTVNWLQPLDGWIDLSESVKVSTGSFEECNLTLVVSEGEALLVDTGYEMPEAERVLLYLKKHGLKLKHIVITHHHDDHDANLALFTMNEGQIFDPAHLPDEAELRIGNKKVRLQKTPGHFPAGDISAVVVEEQILIAGDILYACLPPQLCYGANPEVLIQTLEKIEQQHYKWIVPGHGKVLSGPLMMSMSLSYIQLLYEKLQAIVLRQGAAVEIDQIALADCILHRDWMVEAPALDLHRQNKKELFAKLKRINANGSTSVLKG